MIPTVSTLVRGDILTIQRPSVPAFDIAIYKNYSPDIRPFRLDPELMQRVIYHYWYHTGENMAIRQMLGHTGLPDFVGNIDDEAPYTPHL